jgi:16S rRNA (guanine527-N7)-methyltransferase
VTAAKPLSEQEFQAITGVSRETLGRLEAYARLLRKWNPAINLVAPDSLGDLWRRHMLDSAQLAPLLPDAAGRVADLGSGAGFPGLVLAILGCGEIHLVESDRRKAQFLREVSRETTAGAQIYVSRIEDLSPLSAETVVARGLAPLDSLLDYAARHLAPGGQAILPKGRGWEQELEAARARWRFTVQAHPSRTHAQGRILAISALERR